LDSCDDCAKADPFKTKLLLSVIADTHLEESRKCLCYERFNKKIKIRDENCNFKEYDYNKETKKIINTNNIKLCDDF